MCRNLLLLSTFSWERYKLFSQVPRNESQVLDKDIRQVLEADQRESSNAEKDLGVLVVDHKQTMHFSFSKFYGGSLFLVLFLVECSPASNILSCFLLVFSLQTKYSRDCSPEELQDLEAGPFKNI